MSRTQRPGKMRVVASNRPTRLSQRQLFNIDVRTGGAPAAEAAVAAGDPSERRRPAVAGLALLFIAGCGLGGALAAALGLF